MNEQDNAINYLDYFVEHESPELFEYGNESEVLANAWTLVRKTMEELKRENEKLRNDPHEEAYSNGWDDAEKTHDDFFDWLACSVVMDDSNWEEAPGFYREVICRKLVKLGKLKIDGDEYVMVDPGKE